MGVLDRSIDKILNVITHKEGPSSAGMQQAQNLRSNANAHSFQPALGVISETNTSHRIPTHPKPVNPQRPSHDRYDFDDDDDQDLLPETKYQYPSHIPPARQSRESTNPYAARLPNKESALSKSNETTPALQSYLRSLQWRQKEYINQQIQKEKEPKKVAGEDAHQNNSKHHSNTDGS